jgi:hypothetical protein
MTGYDHKHRQDRAALLADRPPCVWCRCASLARSPDVTAIQGSPNT